jgi:putative transcriptional regulator
MKTNVKVERTKLDLTQEQLADKTGITRQTVHLIEKKKIDIKLSTAYKLASFFGLPVDVLFKENINNK